MRIYNAFKGKIHRVLGIPKDDWKVILLSSLGTVGVFAVFFVIGFLVTSALGWIGGAVLAGGWFIYSLVSKARKVSRNRNYESVGV